MNQSGGVFKSAWANVGGLRIHAQVSVDSTPPAVPVVVLVHSFGLSSRYMMATAEWLAPTFRVYVPDLPGFGDSDKPSRVFDVAELADWLNRWIIATGLERVALLRNSFGCQAIADLAAGHARRLERVVFQGPTTPPEERSWFWQFVRWRQSQRYNPSSLGLITWSDY